MSTAIEHPKQRNSRWDREPIIGRDGRAKTARLTGRDVEIFVSAKVIPHGIGGCEQVETGNRPADVGVSFYVCAYA